MNQEQVWDREYRDSKFLAKENKPSRDIVLFLDFLKRKEKIIIENLHILDLGCGAGRNAYHFASLGNSVIGLEISETALTLARRYAEGAGFDLTYHKQDIGSSFPLGDNLFDIAIDVLSSNSLTEVGREMYLKETHRVLKPRGYFFVKALAKEGDTNAKNLLKQFPSKEKDTYVMPETGIIERVWSKEDLVFAYEKYFTILHIEKKTRYTRFNNQSYKRNFWIVYMQK